MDESLVKRILHLYEVEKLSFRQIARQLSINRATISKVVNLSGTKLIVPKKDLILDPYQGLIAQWYSEYPLLKAVQVYERLKGYGYTGSYPSLVRFTRELRKRKPRAYHALEFLPGEEAQVDWFVITNVPFGKLYAFILVLSYSRFAWGKVYPRNSFEFFVDGHIECFKKIGGVPHRCRYDNLKSVVITRRPEIQYNPQFLDLARFYGFSLYACNPHAGNEKGRVERIGRDLRSFIYANTSKDLTDFNCKFWGWLEKRNDTQHRTTSKTPNELLKREKLLPLPKLEYQAGKIIPTRVSSTGFVEFETNKYSVPTSCSGHQASLVAYPEKIVVLVSSQPVATHKRSFLKKQTLQNPLHREKLLNRTPHFKHQRILQLMRNMDPSLNLFLTQAKENSEDEMLCAYQLFKLLKVYSRAMLISAVREACSLKAFQLKTVLSLLNHPVDKEADPVYPKDTNLLSIDYRKRRLEDYDKFV